jgi:pyrroloquinoline quinone (PQQ) biosynthesis protein C
MEFGMTVSKIRNGNPAVGYMTLKRVVEALGLTMAEISKPRSPESLTIYLSTTARDRG